MTYDANNIFSKILRGEIPSHKICEDEHTLAFMDVMPQVDGHCLVIPKVGSRNLLDPVNTLLYADTDGWDACLYPDKEGSANVCYRHSGGNERSTETQRVTTGAKRSKFRANAAFGDHHIESRRDAPKRLFTLERD